MQRTGAAARCGRTPTIRGWTGALRRCRSRGTSLGKEVRADRAAEFLYFTTSNIHAEEHRQFGDRESRAGRFTPDSRPETRHPVPPPGEPFQFRAAAQRVHILAREKWMRRAVENH